MTSVLILGASGMLGHALFSRMYASGQIRVHATTRNADRLDRFFSAALLENLVDGVEAENFESAVRTVEAIKPDWVINCIGVIKQRAGSNDPITAISINALFPHRLAMLCKGTGTRLIHVSTDCVFDGQKGNYVESDPANALDLYGRTKFMGEPNDPHCLTLRTSIIGHELLTRQGLVEWFLSQTGRVKGYTRAIFSGFSTLELADIIINHVLENAALQGLYHLSSTAISKHDLLRIIARQYGLTTDIAPSRVPVIDRTLDSARFKKATGYLAPNWPEMIARMHQDFLAQDYYQERQSS
jgi:dTDP-4-dehydrorhamnose reductase